MLGEHWLAGYLIGYRLLVLMSFKILVSAIESPLGKALEHELEREPFKLLTPESSELNWGDRVAVGAYIRAHRPNLIINCCGWDEVHHAEHSALPEYHNSCEFLMSTATQIAELCAELNIPLLQASSYRVFGADNKGTHSEKDDVSPMSEAGRAFVAAEQAVIARVPQHIILRFSWVIGAYGNNLLTRLLKAFLRERQ